MNKKLIYEEVSKLDIEDMAFNFALIDCYRIINLSPVLKQTHDEICKKAPEKEIDFINEILECAHNRMLGSTSDYNQAVINTVKKRFEPVQLTDKQIQFIISAYGCISEKDAQELKRMCVAKLLLEM